MLRRFSALIPIATTATAVALMIVLLTAGTKTSNGQTHFWVSLNTSKIGQDLVQVTTTEPSSDDPFGIITSGLDDLLGGLLSNITEGINESFGDIQGAILGNLTQALGVKDTYRLFLTTICEGDFENADDPNSDVTITECVRYEDQLRGLRNISNSIPSSFVVGMTKVTVPLVDALGAIIDSVISIATTGARAMLALLIISVISVGITLVGSLITLIVDFRAPLVWMNMGFSMLGASAMMLFASVTTGIVVAGSSSIGDLGTAFGLDTARGRSFLAMTWIAAVFSQIANTYWFVFWFVETRTTAFTRRLRTKEEIGDWRGIFQQTWMNLKVSQTQGEK